MHVQGEGVTTQAVSKVFHAPYCSLHLEQEVGVVLYRARNLAAGISLGVVFTLGVNLCEDGPNTSGFVFVTEAGIGDEVERAVSAGVPNHRGRA